PFEFEAVLRGIKRRRRHDQHRQESRQHHAILRARFRDVFSLTGGVAALPFCAPTLFCSASKSGKIARGGAVAATACPASLASIRAFTSCAAGSGYAVQSTLPPAASMSLPAKRSSSVGSAAKGHTVCGNTRACSGALPSAKGCIYHLA